MTARIIMKLHVAERRDAGDEVACLTLKHDRRKVLPAWSAGAHIDLRLPDGKMRQYSLVGDPQGFALVLGDRHLLIPDRVGNNRFDSYANIFENGQVGLLFLVPGMAETLRHLAHHCHGDQRPDCPILADLAS